MLSRPENPLMTAQQAIDHVSALLRCGRRALAHGLRQEFYQNARARSRLRRTGAAPLAGYCGLAQSFLAYAAQDRNDEVKTFAIQSLPFAHFGHVAATLILPTQEGRKMFLLDPTFQQFCINTDASLPGHILSQKAEGKMVAEALRHKGFCILTPERAALYLASFCGGQNVFDNDDAAFSFMQNPPSHPYNYWFPRHLMAQEGYAVLPRARP